jgi:CRISPR-associated endonuclease Cas2
MILVMYDISNVKTQGRVRKYLKKYGTALQYSVYEIHNTPSQIAKICREIELITRKLLKGNDSLVIIPISDSQLTQCIFLGGGGFDVDTFLEI